MKYYFYNSIILNYKTTDTYYLLLDTILEIWNITRRLLYFERSLFGTRANTWRIGIKIKRLKFANIRIEGRNQ